MGPQSNPPHTQLPAKLCLQQLSLPLLALIDSGAEQSFLDKEVVHQAGIKIEPLETPVNVCALDGKILAKVTHRTEPLLLILSGNHREYIQFFVFSAPKTALVLGTPMVKVTQPSLWLVHGSDY